MINLFFRSRLTEQNLQIVNFCLFLSHFFPNFLDIQSLKTKHKQVQEFFLNEKYLSIDQIKIKQQKTYGDFELIEKLMFFILSFVRTSYDQIYTKFLIIRNREKKKMNFLFVPYIGQIPEWKQCYYDYSTLSRIIHFVSKSARLINGIQLFLEHHKSKGFQQKLKHISQRIRSMIQLQRQKFCRYSTQESDIICMFIQFKLYEVREKLFKYQHLIKIVSRNNHEIMLLIQNLYIQVHYLNNATKFNIAQQQKAINYLNDRSLFFQFQNQYQRNKAMKRMENQVEKLFDKIQLIFNMYNEEAETKGKYFQQKIQRKEKKVQFYQPLIIGFIMGGLVGFLGGVVVINVVNNIEIGSNTIFRDQFPVWRGASETIFYIWILGLNVLFFEKSSINFKLIFHFQKHNLPHSRFFFLLASVFSFIYLTLFIIFLLELVGTFKVDFPYLGHLFWLIFLVYVFQPLPLFQQQGRFYMLRKVFQTLTPCCNPMNFLTIWIAEQMVSLSQPMTDLFYSFCLIISKNASNTIQITRIFNSALVMVIFLYRMIQNFRLWHQISQSRPDKVYDNWAPPFLGFVRACFGLLTSIAALLNRLKAFQNVLIFWIITAILATLISWYVDVRGDWGLLQHQQQHVLRNKILFPESKPLYYFMGLFNLVLRTAWVLTLSSFQLGSGDGLWPLLFIMIISFIQIFRRGVWNMLRLQFQHIKNCGQYQATIRDSHILKQVQTKALQIQKHRRKLLFSHNNPSLQRILQACQQESIMTMDNSQKYHQQKIRKLHQLQIFKQKLNFRKEMKTQVFHNLKANYSYLNELKRELRLLQISNIFLETVHLIDDQP